MLFNDVTIHTHGAQKGLRTHWAVTLVCAMALHASAGTSTSWAKSHEVCLVSSFRTLALTTHDVAAREQVALEWLARVGPLCTDVQLMLLASNRPSWMGHADTARVAGAIDGIREQRQADEAEAMSELFDSPATRPEGVEVLSTPEAPTPVVPGAGGAVGGGSGNVGVVMAPIVVPPGVPVAPPNVPPHSPDTSGTAPSAEP